MQLDNATTAGTKRKAEGPGEGEPAPRRIKALAESVVNKIAAGEIIIAPVNALKELMENAVDAGATNLEILVKDGGLKLLQITDNGCGIEKDDLSILCERHTTSKLSSFEDLKEISTYGFRGEALASISQIAHLSVTTKTKDSAVAWQAKYLEGRMVPPKPGASAEPKSTAGRQGTQIKVEDLFFNIPIRRKAFRSPAEEFSKIMDMVGRYAIHCSNIGFSCKKAGDASVGLSVSPTATTVDRIRQIYGSDAANELIEFSSEDVRWQFKASGFATNANYSHKKTTLLLFVNHRCVESRDIKKSLEEMYKAFLPKNAHPFVYLNLEINPHSVDVNVHPTKRYVKFEHEDEIVRAICEEISSKLASVDKSRAFMTQSLLPGVKVTTISPQPGDDAASSMQTPGPGTTRRRRNSNSLVRTDTSVRKITTMFHSTPGGAATEDAVGEGKDFLAMAAPENINYEIVDRQAVTCRLTSIKELRADVREEMHNELTDIISNHTFVGVVDERRRLAAIQGGIKLYLVDYGLMSYEYFYQLGLTDFGNFGTIRFTPPLDLREMLRIGAEAEKAALSPPESDFDVESLVEKVAEQLIERREMLAEYFSFEVSPAGDLVSIPLLMKGYTPPLVKLPRFLLRLGPAVNWREEKACFESFLRELAGFYAPEQLPALPGDEESAKEEEIDARLRGRRRNVRWAVENVLFPAFKARLVATGGLMEGVMEVADLKGLYRVFERC
ncbi:related to DNA mismatch repair protein [Cephalotrichum gorgonifer]|uniref:Related to DNA mismatch repair protein n=1 Tax=Cephalotrichum gorgonifer TaxID=2041049 RepID=A0AAE8MS31_9PEZI|nr:related to DNA mismatch repair protein [Cephalotrichum gorgonifer]